MRSTVSVCAAVASIGLILVGASGRASAADPKSKSANKSANKSSGDDTDKGIGKTLQWEDKVMGPDDKRSELDKILKAQAINKAATEKAAREKEKSDKEAAAREAKEAAAPKAQTTKRGGEVALPTMPDEDTGSSNSNKKGKSVEISPKLDSASAAAPLPPSKPADDKFIDKLLKEEGGSKRKKTAANDDKALLDILATDKPTKPVAKGKGKGKGDGVDSLLQEADKAPVMATPKIKHETPEWQKPEIQATSTPAPAIVKPVPRRDDGVIHVVQGAATPGGRPTPPAARPTPPPARQVQASTMSSSRRQAVAPAPARGGSWNDPFADAPRKSARQSRDADQGDAESPPPRRNAVAARQARDDDDDFAAPRRKAVAARSTRDDDDDAPPPRRNASAPAPAKPTRAAVSRSTRSGDDDSWDDPFDKKAAASSRRASAPAAKPAAPRGGAWKDPFTDGATAKPARGTVAMRDNGRDNGKDDQPSKWEAASKRNASSDESGSSDAPASKGRWGILKKR